MEDEPQVESYVDETVPFMVRQATDKAVLLGDGTAPNILGLLNVSNLQDIDWTTTGSGATKVRSKPLNILRRAKTLIRFGGRSMATHFLLNPYVWDDIVLSESSAGGYYYGTPQNDFVDRVWGLPVILTDHLVSTLTADDVNGVVGDFSPMWIQLRMRRELETEWGYINDDWVKEIEESALGRYQADWPTTRHNLLYPPTAGWPRLLAGSKVWVEVTRGVPFPEWVDWPGAPPAADASQADREAYAERYGAYITAVSSPLHGLRQAVILRVREHYNGDEQRTSAIRNAYDALVARWRRYDRG